MIELMREIPTSWLSKYDRADASSHVVAGLLRDLVLLCAAQW
jgi:hypothetical protein